MAKSRNLPKMTLLIRDRGHKTASLLSHNRRQVRTTHSIFTIIKFN